MTAAAAVRATNHDHGYARHLAAIAAHSANQQTIAIAQAIRSIKAPAAPAPRLV